MVTPPVAEQPQVITSPDGKLQTLRHLMRSTRFGHRIVEGAARNISSDASLTAEITVDFYDADGALIGTEVDMVRRLDPGKTGAFEAVHSGPKRSYVKRYELKVANKG